MREKQKNNVKTILKEGSFEDLIRLMEDDLLPKKVRDLAQQKLVADAAKAIDTGLWKRAEQWDPARKEYRTILVSFLDYLKLKNLPEDLVIRAQEKLREKIRKSKKQDSASARALVEHRMFLPNDVLSRVIAQLGEGGYFRHLIELAKDTNLSEELRQDARSKIMDAAEKTIKDLAIYGFYFDIAEIAKDKNLPRMVQKLAQDNLLNAAERLIESGYYDNLIRLANDPDLPKEMRERAEKKAIECAREEEVMAHDPSMW